MGRKRDKLIKRVVAFYKNVFKFETPLKVIIDGNFLAFAYKKKLDLKTDIAKVLDENVFVVLTSCVLSEIEKIDSKIPGILNYTLKYTTENCTHGSKYPEQCILEHVGKRNNKKYVVATQDMIVRRELRKIPGVPIIYFDNNVILTEKPSIASKEASEKRESLKQEPIKSEKKVLSEKKIEANEFMKEEYKKSLHFKRKDEDLKLMRINGRLKKKAKGPNPLSCLKKKTDKIKYKLPYREGENIDNSGNNEKIETVRNKLKLNSKE